MLAQDAKQGYYLIRDEQATRIKRVKHVGEKVDITLDEPDNLVQLTFRVPASEEMNIVPYPGFVETLKNLWGGK